MSDDRMTEPKLYGIERYGVVLQQRNCIFARELTAFKALLTDRERVVEIVAVKRDEYERLRGLERGEYICQKCYLRKNSEVQDADF